MKKEFVVERDGRSFVLYAGLLDLAHERGLKAISTTLVQIPNEMNGMLAICHATVETEQGTFTGLGDACPTNVTRLMAPHLIRMAETRAKARALRDAVNVGVTALEELADSDDLEDEPIPATPPAGGRSGTTRRALRPVDSDGQLGEHEESADRDGELPGLVVQVEPARGVLGAGGERGGLNGRAAPAAAGPNRAGGPAATPKQIQTIQRMARAAGKSVDTDGLSRAQASEIISNLIGEMGQLRAS